MNYFLIKSQLFILFFCFQLVRQENEVALIPAIKFEDQRLTSFAGLVIYQPLFSILKIKQKLKACFSHRKVTPIFGYHIITLLLVIHLIIGYRRLRHIDYYKDDPMVKRLLGVIQLPDVSTVSRILNNMDEKSIANVRRLNRELVLNRLLKSNILRITLDFDGSVYHTFGKNIEGTAVGYNKKKKGARSYYPLLCTIAQLGLVFDLHHRPGNVHDSNGAKKFIRECIEIIRYTIPNIKIEVRMDSAFFSDDIVTMLDSMSVEFTISVPFERFAELKNMVENRQRWKYFNNSWSYFESDWKPKKWVNKYRFIFIRQKSKKIYKGPIQLDFFIPHEYGHEFKVILTNKHIKAKKVLMFHNGRGAQENIFGELKSQSQMNYIPVKRLTGNQLYIMAAIFAHNLTRELQLHKNPIRERGTTEKRHPLWKFNELTTIRNHIIQRAGRLTKPQGKLTLTLSPNKATKKDLLYYLQAFNEAA